MILLLDHFDSFTYNIVQGLQCCGVDVKVQPDITGEINLEGITHIVLSPGAGKPAARHAGQILLKKSIQTNIPVLGVCLGHQIIAEFFGATVVQMDQPAHAQECAIMHNASGLFQGLEAPMIVGQYHSLHVLENSLPKDLIVTARNNENVVMGLRHTVHQISSVQFHPESVFTSKGQRVLENFVSLNL